MLKHPASFCQPDERAIVERFFNAASGQASEALPLLLRHEGRHETAEQDILWRLKAFMKGFSSIKEEPGGL